MRPRAPGPRPCTWWSLLASQPHSPRGQSGRARRRTKHGAPRPTAHLRQPGVAPRPEPGTPRLLHGEPPPLLQQRRQQQHTKEEPRSAGEPRHPVPPKPLHQRLRASRPAPACLLGPGFSSSRGGKLGGGGSGLAARGGGRGRAALSCLSRGRGARTALGVSARDVPRSPWRAGPSALPLICPPPCPLCPPLSSQPQANSCNGEFAARRQTLSSPG